MSMEVPLHTLESVAGTLGPTAYAVVSDSDRPPRITHVTPTFSDSSITFGLGRTSIELLRRHGQLGLLWPATDQEGMSLIVDAEVGDVLEDGRVRVVPTSAVRHRPAPTLD
ncbi:MAG: hypothetical protein AAGA90_10920 [Actinomycetota bacterium]